MTTALRAASSRRKAGVGDELHAFARELFPICRSLTGDGVRETLRRIQEKLPEGVRLRLSEVPSGTRVFDWTIPDEWNIRAGYVLDPSGRKIIDFKKHALHVVGYSEPVDKTLTLEELQPHLHSLPAHPEAIPYVTSYYRRTWGFCLPHSQRRRLKKGRYRAVIDSTLAPGSMTYGELLLPGRSSKEVLLSTYVCHPWMGNNEVSGPVVTTFLARWLASLPERRLSYRIVFVPETIGAIAYISRNLAELKERVVAGYQITCVGDERAYTYLPSRSGRTLADRVAAHVIKHHAPGFKLSSWLDRGSDERQYCSPGVDLPVASLMRSKYGEYPEYHTSLDDLSLITPAGLGGAYELYVKCLRLLEANRRYRVTTLCEPQLGKRGLYPTLSTKDSYTRDLWLLCNVIDSCDGEKDLIDIAELLKVPADSVYPIIEKLKTAELIREEKQ